MYNDRLIADPYEREDQCVALRSRTCFMFCYPIHPDVLKAGGKVLTRDGRVVKKVNYGTSEGAAAYIGLLDDQWLTWDGAGRAEGPYKDSPLDLFVPERYWYRDWRKHISMSYAEWELKFGRRHPNCELPD